MRTAAHLFERENHHIEFGKDLAREIFRACKRNILNLIRTCYVTATGSTPLSSRIAKTFLKVDEFYLLMCIYDAFVDRFDFLAGLLTSKTMTASFLQQGQSSS